MTKISACLVVHHEAKLIRRCLDSLKGEVDQIIVVHDGPCLDKTLEICADYRAEVFIRERIGEAEPHRPFSFSQATGEWILQIDADEYLSSNLKKNLRALVQAADASAYEFLWPIWDGEKYLTKHWPRKRCLFKKNNVSFLGLPHYVAAVSGEVKSCDFILEHKPDYNGIDFPEACLEGRICKN